MGWAAWTMLGDHSETGFHCAQVDWLPSSASDVSFYRNQTLSFTEIYEFRIPKADFEALARKQNWPLRPAKPEDSVMRFTMCLPSGHPEYRQPFYAMSSKGLFYEYRQSNNGGTAVLFDEATSMAYVDISDR